MAAALGLADEEESAARERFVARALAAIEAPSLGPALELAEEAKKEKAELPTRLAALATALAGAAELLTLDRALQRIADREIHGWRDQRPR